VAELVFVSELSKNFPQRHRQEVSFPANLIPGVVLVYVECLKIVFLVGVLVEVKDEKMAYQARCCSRCGCGVVRVSVPGPETHLFQLDAEVDVDCRSHTGRSSCTGRAPTLALLHLEVRRLFLWYSYLL